MKMTVGENFVLEFPGIPETEPEVVKPRYQTIEDFATKEEFDAYIKEFCMAKMFEPTIQGASRYNQRGEYEVKFYISDSIVHRFDVSSNDFGLRYNRARWTGSEVNIDRRKSELADMPIDIFLGLTGFKDVVITWKGYTSRRAFYRANQNHKVLMAWILGNPYFREFGNIAANDYDEALALIKEIYNTKSENNESYKEYETLFGVGKKWRI